MTVPLDFARHKKSRGFHLGFCFICFLVARAVIAAWMELVALFQALEAVRVWGSRDCAAA